jgi:prepilin-type processing-associated H-X9-DG protein
MNCDDTNLSAYLDHELPAPERRAVEAHLRSCPECAATLKDLERVRTMLLTQAVPMGLHGPVIEQIRNEEKTASARNRRFSMAVAAAVLAVATVAAIVYVWNSPGPGSPNEQIPVVAGNPEDEPLTKRQTVAQDATQGAVTPTQVTPVALAETKLPLTLAGTLLSDNPQAVLVNNDSGEQRVYRPGDTVLDGVVLREVQQGRVILDNQGVREVLTKGPGIVATRPRVDGEWLMAVLADGKTSGHGPVLTLNEVNGTVRFLQEGRESFPEGRIEGRTLILKGSGPSEGHELRGDFNSTFTEVVLTSAEFSRSVAENAGHDLPEAHTYALKLSRIDAESPARDSQAIMRLRNDDIRAMYPPLKAYAEDHEGQFPATPAQLLPDYVETLELYADREDRIVSYIPGLELQDLSQLDPIPNCRNVRDPVQTLLAHEAKLQQFWGGPAPFAPTLIEVTYGDPDQIFTLNVQGGLSGRSIHEDDRNSPAPEARWAAMVASDQNNLKQLGLVNKMFQNENWGEHTIPGFCTVYPEYLTDPSVLTSPWDDPGTASYEILFPAAAQEDLMAMGIEMLAANGVATDPSNPALNAMAQSTVPIMFNKSDIPAVGNNPAGRNVLFLDGHVERLKLSDFQKKVGPFLR